MQLALRWACAVVARAANENTCPHKPVQACLNVPVWALHALIVRVHVRKHALSCVLLRMRTWLPMNLVGQTYMHVCLHARTSSWVHTSDIIRMQRRRHCICLLARIHDHKHARRKECMPACRDLNIMYVYQHAYEHACIHTWTYIRSQTQVRT